MTGRDPTFTAEDELRSLREQLHIYEAIVVAADDAHAVLDVVLEASDPDDAHRALRRRYGFTDPQAWAVMEVQFRRMTALDRQKIADRRSELVARAAAVEAELADGWRVKRPFSWGVLLLMDRDASDVPSLGDAPVSAWGRGLAVKVLHAQDVDATGYLADAAVSPAQVEVQMRIGSALQPGAETFRGAIDVPSGVLTVGDAEREDALAIGPGRWTVEIDCTPPDHAEIVRVWLSPVC